MSNPTLEAALWYARNGYRVFPVSGKVPSTENGFKDATQDEDQINQWWMQQPNAGIAVATGNGLVVVDIDDMELNHDLLFNFNHLHMPRSSTPRGGRHLWFSGQARNSVNAARRVDVRGDGGYVVVDPSPGYQWHEDHGPIALSELPQIPIEILELVQPKKPQEIRTNETGDVMLGGRNNYLTQVGGALQRKGLAYETLSAALQAENEARCNPPLSTKEVEVIARSISRYVPEAPIEAQAPDLKSVLAEMEANNGSLVHVASLGNQMVAYLGDKDKVRGLPTGIADLDKLLGGGKRLGEVTCWHAEAKTGKNTLWHYLMHDMLERGIKIAYASRELSPAEEVIPNLLSIAFTENSWLKDIDQPRQLKYLAKITDWPLYFASGYGHFPSDAIIKWVTEAKAQGIEYFWFDHLHYMLEDPEDHKAASKLIKELKALARSLAIHIDIIIQPNKLMDGQKLSLNSIKGGAAMGQAIDNLLILERVKNSNVPNVNKLTLEVARSKLARLGSLYLQFDPDTTRFAIAEAEDAVPAPRPFSDGSNYVTNHSTEAYDKLRTKVLS